MRIGLYGGSFDPPHRGHLLVARAARNAFALHRVLLAPVARQPLKPAAATASFAQRMEMTALLCAEEHSGRLEASAVDAPRPDGAANYTVDTLVHLRASLTPDDTLFVVVGADSFLDLPRWREPNRLLAVAEWIVVSRPGMEKNDLDRLALTSEQRAQVHWLGGVLDPVSATDVRARLAAGESCEGLVPPSVLLYIHRHGLYA